jgi:hypothetical protein
VVQQVRRSLVHHAGYRQLVIGLELAHGCARGRAKALALHFGIGNGQTDKPQRLVEISHSGSFHVQF